MALTVILAVFCGFVLLGCAPGQVKPGCENSWANDANLDLAMNVGAIGLSEYLLQNPEHRQDARKAIKAAMVVLKQDVVTLDVIVSALQKGGEEPLTLVEISQMIDIALEKAKFLRNELNKALKH